MAEQYLCPTFVTCDQISGMRTLNVTCPFCGFDYVHFEAPIHIPSDRNEAWFGRGSAIYIPCFCESGHRWLFGLGFHKGQTYSFIEPDWEHYAPGAFSDG